MSWPDESGTILNGGRLESNRRPSEKCAATTRGLALPGVNGCVAVPGRNLVILNLAIEKTLLPNLTRLDRLLDTLPYPLVQPLFIRRAVLWPQHARSN